MEYRRFGNKIVVRMDRDEEILEQLARVAKEEGIRLAEISALGAVRDFTVGVFKTDEKKYYSNRFQGSFEIVSLTGTISTMDGAYYAHLHMSAGDENGQVFGGHLNRAEVSATCEMVITVIDGTVDRAFSEEIGLNLFQFAGVESKLGGVD
jgi:predicted DNA-binding protein with PD1-like motif